MNYDQIHSLFKQRYNQSSWKQFLTQAFARTRLLASPEILTGIDANVASQVQKLGFITLDENGIERQIAVYEVTLAEGIILERNRVGLRNLLRKYWKNIDAAFIVYHLPGVPNWRFTYVSELAGYNPEGDFVKIKTEPKRYTYVLGEGESTRTAAERFTAIANKGSKATLDDVKEAFSVEKLSKAFFDEYKKHYDIFCDFMVSKPNIRQTIFNGDEKGIRDFNKKFLGRIVFLYFIQKKGWLGVPLKEDWGNGDFNFLTKQFDNFRNKDLFYKDFLSILFFETLNTKRKEDIFNFDNAQFILKNTSLVKIPFLSGGLFDEDDKKQRGIIFPANLIKSLFDFFNQYNFTIYEDSPNDHTVAVDPEMLGHIFENLLEDNKDKGAFYTPKEIVHYMCQESLIEYLCTALEIEDENKEKEAITLLLKKKELDPVLKPEIKNLNKALDIVKICDPAIGSGAFPMGLLHEIFTAKQTLHTFEHGHTKTFDASAVKLNIIQNSIYGVDIEKGAVDIARLRFWLSLIVDEEKPQALPNLDYKIVVGNSLVSKLGDDIIDIDWTLNETSHGLFGADLAKQKGELLKKISKEQKEFFKPNSDKKKLAAEIRNSKIDLLITQLELMVKTQGIETKPSGTNRTLVKQTVLYLQTIGWKNTIRDLHKLKGKAELQLQFFDWKLDFPEVMNEQIATKVGFDIVIGNPPYVQIKQISEIDKNIYVKHFKFSTGRFNLFYFFLELSETLTVKNGVTSYIIPDRILLNTQCSNIREWLLNSQTILEISSFDESVFENAVVDTIILAYRNDKNKSEYLFTRPNLKVEELQNSKKDTIPFTQFTESPNKQFSLSHDLNKSNLLNKIRLNSKILGDITDTKDGIIQSKIPDELFLKIKKNAFCKKLLFGKNINRYELNYEENWVNYQHEKMMSIELARNGGGLRLRKKEIFERPKILTRQTADRIIGTIDFENYYYANTIHGTAITDNDYDIKFILGILNSKLIEYYYRSTTSEGGKVFAQVKIEILRKVPIRYLRTQDVIIKKVDKILSFKKDNKTTPFLEQEIDNLVYRLYELTYDEVKIIDPAFSLSKKEYEAIKLE